MVPVKVGSLYLSENIENEKNHFSDFMGEFHTEKYGFRLKEDHKLFYVLFGNIRSIR